MVRPKKGTDLKVLKMLAMTIGVTMLCLAAACQPTPEVSVVIQKDNFEGLVQNTPQAVSDELPQPSAGDAGRITWESAYTNQYQGGNSTQINVRVDAALDMRQSTGSVYLVEPGEYDLDFAQKAVNYFLGGEYYDDVYTKDDILLKILPLKQAIQNMVDIYGSVANAESLLNMYQHQYENAPQDNAPGKIAFKNAGYDYIGLKGYPYDGAVSELYVGNGGMGYTNFYYVIQDGKRVFNSTNEEYSGTPARNMKTSYDDAKKTADNAICELYGKSMSLAQTDLYNIYAIDETYGSALRRLLDDTCSQCYMFTFTPIYGGLPQLYAPEARNENDMTDEGVAVYEQSWDYEYSMKWPAQCVQVVVDDTGIVQFWGFSPTRVAETVNDNVEMLSFDEIFEKFKKDIFYSSVWSYNGLEKVDIDIDRIVFGMIRVPVKDNPNAYYMLPAWQFIGSKKEVPVENAEIPEDIQAAINKKKNELKAAGLDDATIEKLDENSGYAESGKTFLVLNALDGSIIDTSYYDENAAGTLEKTIGVNK